MQERDRLGDLCPARDRNCAPGGAQRLVERRQGIVDRFGGDRPLSDRDPGREAIRKLRDKASAQQDDLRPCRETLTPGEPAARRFDVGPRRARAGSAPHRPSRRANRCSAKPRRAGSAIRLRRTARKRRREQATARVFPAPRIAGRAFVSAADRLTTCAVIGESRSLLRVIAITIALEFEREFRTAGRDNPALGHHMHDIRLDVIEQPLIVRNDDKSALRVAKGVDALGDDFSARRCRAPNWFRRGRRPAARAEPSAAPRTSSSRPRKSRH